MSCQKITWMQPRGLICLMARMRAGHAWREVKICVFAVTLSFMAIWLIFSLLAIFNHDIETMDPIEALVFSMLCGFIFACLYQLHWLEPSQVILDDAAIVVAGRFRRRYRYDQIAGVRFDTVRWGASSIRIMLIARHNGRDFTLGVPHGLDLSEVVDFLKSRGVEATNATEAADDLAGTHAAPGTAAR